MRGVIKVVAVLLLVLVAGGLVLAAIARARESSDRLRCLNNVKQLALAAHNYESTYGHFPSGTVPNADLPPEHRLSWATEVCPAFLLGGYKSLLDPSKP